MATFKISDLTNTDSPTLATVIPCVQLENTSPPYNIVTKQLRVGSIKALFDKGTFQTLTGGAGVKLSTASITSSGTVNFHAPGLMCLYAGQSLPSGWLWCDGASYSSTSSIYLDLFNRIGTTYGSNGANTFRVPNLTGRAVCGLDNIGGTNANVLTDEWSTSQRNVLGGTTGTIANTLTDSQIPMASHNHTVNSTFTEGYCENGRDGGRGITYTNDWNVSTDSSAGPGYVDLNLSVSSPTGAPSTFTSASSHPHLPPFLLLRYIIKL